MTRRIIAFSASNRALVLITTAVACAFAVHILGVIRLDALPDLSDTQVIIYSRWDRSPDIIEEWKWDTAVWSQHGNVVAGGVFKDHVKFNFFKGASLNDPHGLFNAGLEAKATRAIDIHEGDNINEAALKDLIRAAVALNTIGAKKK